MTIETLLKVLPPPANPTYVFEGPWDVIETGLRTRLPQDYKDFARIYGSGEFFGFFELIRPETRADGDGIVPNTLLTQRSFINDPSVPVYPRPGGLLVCGWTFNGQEICWLTRGATPDEWPIVVWDCKADEEEQYKTFDCDLTDFLAGIVERGGVFPGYEDEKDDGWLAQQEPFKPTPEPPYD